MKNVFKLTNCYLILITPLILYTLFSTIYLSISASGGKLLGLIFAILLFILMTAAFMSGWFNMIKNAVLGGEREDANSLIKDFPSGVGEYFLPSLGALILIFVFSGLFLTVSYHLGAHFIGKLDLSAQELSTALQSSESINTFLASQSPENLMKMLKWNSLILWTVVLLNFLLMLYIPALFFKSKNPFVAYWLSLKDLFSKKVFKTLSIFVLILLVNFVISLLSTIFGANNIIYFVLTLANFYFITLMSVGIFYYYNKEFVSTLIGTNIDVEI